MANNVQEVYRMILEADNKHAVKSFEKLNKVAEDLVKIQERLEDANSGANATEEMNRLTKSTIEATQAYKDLKKEVEGSKNLASRVSLDPTISPEIKKEMKAYTKELEGIWNKAVEKMNTEIKPSKRRSSRAVESRTGRELVRGRDASIFRDENTSGEANLARVQYEKKRIRSMRDETLGIGRKAMSSRFINNTNASTWKANRDYLLSRDTQGTDLETITNARNANRNLTVDEVDADSVRGQLMRTRREAQEQYQKTLVRRDELSPEVESSRYAYRKALSDRKEFEEIRDSSPLGSTDRNEAEDALKELAEIIPELHKEYEESLLALDANQKEMKQFNRVVEEVKDSLRLLSEAAIDVDMQEKEIQSDKTPSITQKGDRGGIRGRLSERAFSIGLAAIAAATYQIASTVSRGQQVVEGMRDDSISVGMRTGDYDFRGIRQDYLTQGMDLGWSGQDMLQFSDAMLSSLGYQNQAMQTAGMQNMSEFSKFSGAGAELSTAFTEGLYRTGAIESVDQAKAIQDGFLGAIKASGMEGREKEQLEALASINDNIYRGREASYEEVRSRSLMTSVLSQSGRAFQGENLADFMQSADETIRNSDMFSGLGILLGVGRDPQFAGPEGLYNYKKMTEEGLSADNYNRMMESYDLMGNTSFENRAADMNAKLGTNVGVEELKEFMEKFPNGIPVGEEGEKLLAELEASGGDISQEREDGYMESSDQIRESTDAAAARMEAKLDDNKGVDHLKNIEGWLKSNAGDSTFGSVAYTGASGLISGLTTLGGSVLSGIVSGMVMKGTSTEFLGQAVTALGLGKGGGLLGTALTGGKALLGKGLGLAGSVLTSAALPVIGATAAVGNSVYQVATADDKVHETGKQAGGLAGMWAGAKAGGLGGAALGTALPGIGNVIGGAVGTIAGGIAGYFGGNKIGGAVMDFFRPQKVEAGEADSDLEVLSSTATAEDQATENLKSTTEGLRSDNISRESENLRRQDTLVGRIQNLLDQAAKQNGIIGLLTGLPNEGSSLGVGNLSTTGSGDYWTSTNIQKHDLGVTSDALTAQQLNDWINAMTSDKPNSVMRGTGETFMKAGQESGLDPRYLVAHAAHETGWGTSSIARDKGNMYGIGAFDASPYSSAYGYNNTESGIIEGAKWIAKNYYQGRNAKDLDSMNVDYATDSEWAKKIAATMKGAEKYTEPSMTVNTTVNMNSSGNNESDGQAIANAVNRNLAIPITYRQEYARI